MTDNTVGCLKIVYCATLCSYFKRNVKTFQKKIKNVKNVKNVERIKNV